MKIKITIFLLTLSIGLIVFLYRKNEQKPLPNFSEVKMNQLTTAAQAQTSPNQVRELAPSTQVTNTPRFSPEEREKQMEKIAEEYKNEWRTPIEFYGRIVDESNNVVSGAKVDYSCNDTSIAGTSYYHMASDANGFFSFKGIQGKLLEVDVSKEGYYSYDPHGKFFNYAGENQNFVPDAGNPIVFHLRKKGEGVNLIHLHTSFRIPKDGTPVLIDLATGNIAKSSENAFQVECWTHDTEKKEGWKFDWKCRISVPNGGLQIYDEVFPFLAPEDGYIADDKIDESVTQNVPWTNDFKRNYYIRTASGNFGRMAFRMIAHGDHFCQIDSYFNPADSRNLEPK